MEMQLLLSWQLHFIWSKNKISNPKNPLMIYYVTMLWLDAIWNDVFYLQKVQIQIECLAKERLVCYEEDF